MKYGCIGQHLSHSFSKEIHNKFADYEYEIKEIPSHCLDSFLTKKDFSAINVTIPYKQDVIPFLSFIDPVAEKIGAVNTIVNKDGELYGYNTDYYGLKSLIEINNILLVNKSVAILGTGGTSKTAVSVVQDLGAAEIIVVSRNAGEKFITYDELARKSSEIDIVINTTPCGMYPIIMNTPVDISDFKNISAVIDVIYNPIRSELILDAESRGIKAVSGLYMLVSQAAFAVEKFINTKIPDDKVYSVFSDISREKENIVLVGMPGSGKSTIGKRIAQITGKVFIDTDEEIIKQENMAITDIFSLKGENEFRKIESDIIEKISLSTSSVISTGGGAVLNKNNILNLKRNGKIIFLDRPLKKLIPTEDRPLSGNFNDLKKIYTERYDIYCNSADFKVDVLEDIEKTVNLITDL